MHQAMAAARDRAFAEIKAIQQAAREGGKSELPHWLMIVMHSPKRWTGPKTVDGKPCEGTWRAHQVPFSDLSKPEHMKLLEDWMRSYGPKRCSMRTAPCEARSRRWR